MQKILTICLLLLGFSLHSQILSNKQIEELNLTDQLKSFDELGNAFIDKMNGKDFESAHEMFSEKLKERLNQKRLSYTWKQLKGDAEGNAEQLDTKIKRTAQNDYGLFGFVMGDNKYDLQFTLNEEKQIKSLQVIPYTSPVSWDLPDYAEPGLIQVEALKIGDKDPLYAEFVKPANLTSFPIVVMVHGSGPNDMDGTVGPNKVFKDLAYGLASNGIGSIRYNKRTYDYPTKMTKKYNEVDFDDIVVKDAQMALTYAYKKSTNLFLLGHSLGGHLAPVIAKGQELSGVIVMAGNASPFKDLILPQVEYLKENDPETNINEFQLNMLRNQLSKVNSDDYDENTPGQMLPLGLPGKFWMYLKDYQPTEEAASQAWPYLILNGQRDYQVPASEVEVWNNGNTNPLSNSIVYPALNHLFIEGEGASLPSEYNIKSHVSQVVLDDIVEWISQIK